MLKLLAQHGTSRRLSEVREEDPVTATQLKRLGVDYGKADAETLVHFLRYASELQEGMAIHDNEFPAIIWSRKKYGAKAILKDRKSTRLNSSHGKLSRMPSSA